MGQGGEDPGEGGVGDRRGGVTQKEEVHLRWSVSQHEKKRKTDKRVNRPLRLKRGVILSYEEGVWLHPPPLRCLAEPMHECMRWTSVQMHADLYPSPGWAPPVLMTVSALRPPPPRVFRCIRLRTRQITP